MLRELRSHINVGQKWYENAQASKTHLSSSIVMAPSDVPTARRLKLASRVMYVTEAPTANCRLSEIAAGCASAS